MLTIIIISIIIIQVYYYFQRYHSSDRAGELRVSGRLDDRHRLSLSERWWLGHDCSGYVCARVRVRVRARVFVRVCACLCLRDDRHRLLLSERRRRGHFFNACCRYAQDACVDVLVRVCLCECALRVLVHV